MTSRKTIVTAIICAALLTSGCLREFARSVAESRAVEHELKNKYGDEVEVSTSNARDWITVVIVFTDSRVNDQAREMRVKRALESVEIARKKFSAETAPDEFIVQFHRTHPDASIFAPPEFVDVFEFDRELRAIKRAQPPVRVGPGVALANEEATARAVFLGHTGESDVSASPLTLDGLPGQGLSLIPHFFVTGDANKEKALPPREVSFDFAAYYSYLKFKGEVEFKFIVDGQSVLSTKGQFTQTRASGLVTQFCYLKIPYSAFTRLTKGETLRIKIGQELYELTDEQYESIKQMNSFVR